MSLKTLTTMTTTMTTMMSKKIKSMSQQFPLFILNEKLNKKKSRRKEANQKGKGVIDGKQLIGMQSTEIVGDFVQDALSMESYIPRVPQVLKFKLTAHSDPLSLDRVSSALRGANDQRFRRDTGRSFDEGTPVSVGRTTTQWQPEAVLLTRLGIEPHPVSASRHLEITERVVEALADSRPTHLTLHPLKTNQAMTNQLCREVFNSPPPSRSDPDYATVEVLQLLEQVWAEVEQRTRESESSSNSEPVPLQDDEAVNLSDEFCELKETRQVTAGQFQATHQPDKEPRKNRKKKTTKKKDSKRRHQLVEQLLEEQRRDFVARMFSR